MEGWVVVECMLRFKICILPSYLLLRVTFRIIITVFQSKRSTVFCELELLVLRQEILAYSLVFNPGLNLTIFRGTGSGEKKEHGRE